MSVPDNLRPDELRDDDATAGATSGYPLTVGPHLARLVKVDDTPSWASGHADWRCDRCGAQAQTSTALADMPCEAAP